MVSFNDYTPRSRGGQFASRSTLTEDDFPPNSMFWRHKMTATAIALKNLVGDDYNLLIETYIDDEMTLKEVADELSQLWALRKVGLTNLLECTCMTELPDGRGGEMCGVCQAKRRLQEKG